ncbi:MAG: heat-inducible transcriptional repressor HrcA [Dehalococcoidia bacterium]|nr:heat-inducible transcriptional repressor HrcA [Dehalococcoidia bacterium]
MELRLTDRKEAVLKIVIDEYIRTGTPVPSLDIARFHALGVSSATVRNELSWLKQEGYLVQPHTSAGSVPSDRGYRYYVNALLEKEDISPDEQRQVRHMFHQVETNLEEWMGLAAILLSQLVHNAAFVVPPKAAMARLRRLHLISVQELLALLVLVFQDGGLRRQLVAFELAVSQDELDRISNKLNGLYGGMTRPQIMGKGSLPDHAELSPAEDKVAALLAGMMGAEDGRAHQEPRVEGLRNLLVQPEFSRSESVLDIVELLEKRSLLKPVLSKGLDRDVRVIIGEENTEQAMQELSVVISGYGMPDELSGAVGVLGPRRMSYARSMAAVQFLAGLLGQLSAELQGRSPEHGSQ